MAKTMIRYDGLHRRETYDEILGYLERGGGPGIECIFMLIDRGVIPSFTTLRFIEWLKK